MPNISGISITGFGFHGKCMECGNYAVVLLQGDSLCWKCYQIKIKQYMEWLVARGAR